MRLLFNSCPYKGILKQDLPVRFISTRKLSLRELRSLRKQKIKRFYLPQLDKSERDEFFGEFNQFWNQVVMGFDKDHPFWRNVVSSKMQEWENSVAYLNLVLFTLTRRPPDNCQLLIITGSLEEEQVWKEWAQLQGWGIFGAQENIFVKAIRRAQQEFINLLKFIYYVVGVYRNKLLFSKVASLSNEQAGDCTTLIVSLSYPESFKGDKYNDPFFGDLHTFMAKNNEKCMYLSDFLETPDVPLVKRVGQCRDGKVVFPFSVLSFYELWVNLWSVWTRRIDFSDNSFMGVSFSNLLKWNARRLTYALNIHAQMYFATVNKLSKMHKFSRLLYIFEGNVFERACIQAFRKFSHGRIDGYCHAPIYELNLKLCLTEHERQNKPEADQYICPGPYAKKIFSLIGGRPAAKIKAACTLKELPRGNMYQESQLQTQTILVGLEGFLTSTCLLDWLIEHKNCLKGFKVLIREHPNLPVKKLLQQCIHYLPPSFEITGDLSLEECIQKSFCVLYRQTSVGMQALISGVPAIHLAVDTPLSADPMEDLKVGKWVARNSEELIQAIEQIKQLDLACKIKIQEQAKNFAEEFFSVPTDKKLKEFIEV